MCTKCKIQAKELKGPDKMDEQFGRNVVAIVKMTVMLLFNVAKKGEL